jgi:hypothetical protein
MSEPAAFRRSAAAQLVREFAQPRRCSAPSSEGSFICRICCSCAGT